jgi:hypothetical protein
VVAEHPVAPCHPRPLRRRPRLFLFFLFQFFLFFFFLCRRGGLLPCGQPQL